MDRDGKLWNPILRRALIAFYLLACSLPAHGVDLCIAADFHVRVESLHYKIKACPTTANDCDLSLFFRPSPSDQPHPTQCIDIALGGCHLEPFRIDPNQQTLMTPQPVIQSLTPLTSVVSVKDLRWRPQVPERFLSLSSHCSIVLQI
jgi:hypothetical protein